MLNVCNGIDMFTLIVALSVYLPDFDCFNHIVIIDLLNCAYVKLFNKVVYSMGVHQNTWGRVSQAQNRVQKRNDEVWNLRHFQFIWHGCQQVHRQTMAVLLHMCSGFPAKLMEQTIVTSLDDIMRFSHAKEGGKYKRRV